jgi:hypothetical protein
MSRRSDLADSNVLPVKSFRRDLQYFLDRASTDFGPWRWRNTPALLRRIALRMV